MNTKKDIITKEELETQLKNKTIKELALEIGCCEETLRRRCIDFGIKYKWNRQYKRKNIKHMKFGKLSPIKYVDSNKDGRSIWQCRCDCGNICYKIGKLLLGGHTKTCGKCTYQRELLPYWYYRQIEINAKRRKIEFNISREYLQKLFIEQNSKCYYSNTDIELPSRCSEFKKSIHIKNYASLDRTDSSKGYVEENVKWVHKNVNKMKFNFKEKDFLDICIKISQNFKGNI